MQDPKEFQNGRIFTLVADFFFEQLTNRHFYTSYIYNLPYIVAIMKGQAYLTIQAPEYCYAITTAQGKIFLIKTFKSLLLIILCYTLPSRFFQSLENEPRNHISDNEKGLFF